MNDITFVFGPILYPIINDIIIQLPEYILLMGIIGLIILLIGPAKHWHTHCMHPKF